MGFCLTPKRRTTCTVAFDGGIADGRQGAKQMRRGMRAYRETGRQLGWSNCLSHLATAYAQLGQFENALNTLSEARTHVEAYGERCWGVEIYRCTGELLLTRGDPGSVEAEACVQRALAVARRQQAKGLELREVGKVLYCRGIDPSSGRA